MRAAAGTPPLPFLPSDSLHPKGPSQVREWHSRSPRSSHRTEPQACRVHGRGACGRLCPRTRSRRREGAAVGPAPQLGVRVPWCLGTRPCPPRALFLPCDPPPFLAPAPMLPPSSPPGDGSQGSSVPSFRCHPRKGAFRPIRTPTSSFLVALSESPRAPVGLHVCSVSLVTARASSGDRACSPLFKLLSISLRDAPVGGVRQASGECTGVCANE